MFLLYQNIKNYNKNSKKFLEVSIYLGALFLILSLFFLLPITTFSQEGLVPCSGPIECDYDALIQGVNNVINFLIMFAGIVAVLMFVWAGVKLLLSGGNITAKEEAKKIIWNTVIGFIFVLAAWLIVHLILSTFADTSVIDTPLDGV
jgi:hypothetical protein